MNNKKMNIFRPTTSKSGVFLLELILVILFFSIASTVCIEMFVKSYTLSNDSTHLTKSIQIAENIAENFKGSNGPQLDTPLTETFYYDKNGVPATDQNYIYYAIVLYSTEGNISTANIELFTKDTSYYNLQIDKYFQKGVR